MKVLTGNQRYVVFIFVTILVVLGMYSTGYADITPMRVCKVFGMNITRLLYLDTNICPRHHSSTNTAKKAQH